MSEGCELNARRIRVLLVDDHSLVRQGVRLYLEREPDLEVIGEAAEGASALRLVGELRPDVVIVDIGLPDADGVALARRMLSLQPEVRILLLSGVLDSQHLEDALELGVAGYVHKASSANELLAGVRTIMRKETYLSPEVSATLVGRYRELLISQRRHDPAGLSEREIEVLTLVADGCNTKEIAAQLELSIKTVESHRKRLMAKVGVDNVAELTKYAIRKGLTST